MHWPSPFAASSEIMPKDPKDSSKLAVGETDYVDTWKAMEELVKSGKARAIGVSNFSQKEVQRLLDNTKTVPAVHQMELHPYLQQPSFVDWHKQQGIHITQYSPFGNANPIYDKGKEVGKLIHDEVLVAIGEKYGKSGAQVALAWGVAKGRSVIPKSKTEGRIAENLEAVEGDLELTSDDNMKIDELDKKLRFNNPSERFRWKFYEGLDGA
jgi:alcohol dehydrogenase (NADP+)